MNAITIVEVVVFGAGIGSLLYYFVNFLKLMFSFLFSNKPIQESSSEPIQESNDKVTKVYATSPYSEIKQMYRTRPYKRYSYDGGSVKRSHRFYADDLQFINKIAESRNAYTSDVVNSMIGYFIENPELINVIVPDFKKDKPLPAEKELPKQ